MVEVAASPTQSSDGAGDPEIRPVGGPVPVAWREGTLTRARELEALCDWNGQKYPRESDCALVAAIKCHLDAARQAARAQPPEPRKWFWIFRNGPLIERATSNLDAAEAQLLNLAPPDYVLGQMPSLLRHVQRHLRPTDPGRQEFERIARSVGINNPDHPSSQKRTDQDRTRRRSRTSGARSSRRSERQARSACASNFVCATSVTSWPSRRRSWHCLLSEWRLRASSVRPWSHCASLLRKLDRAVVVCPTGQSAPFIP